MRRLFCYGDPEANGLEEKGQEEIDRQFKLEDEWDARLSPEVIRTALNTWLGLMNDLSQWAGRGKSPITAEIQFVVSLAAYWTDELTAYLSDSRGETAGDKTNRQKGNFADFVRAAAEVIPPTYRPGDRWDHAIREARSFLGQ